jgi:hypothetical protein
MSSQDGRNWLPTLIMLVAADDRSVSSKIIRT